MSRKYNQQKQMQKEYGRCALMDKNQCVRYCQTCCNYQSSAILPNQKVCIAYGDNGKAESIWDPSSFACGLYNRPFRALRPRRRSILETKSSASSAQLDGDEDVISLF